MIKGGVATAGEEEVTLALAVTAKSSSILNLQLNTLDAMVSDSSTSVTILEGSQENKLSLSISS